MVKKEREKERKKERKRDTKCEKKEQDFCPYGSAQFA